MMVSSKNINVYKVEDYFVNKEVDCKLKNGISNTKINIGSSINHDYLKKSPNEEIFDFFNDSLSNEPSLSKYNFNHISKHADKLI